MWRFFVIFIRLLVHFFIKYFYLDLLYVRFSNFVLFGDFMMRWDFIIIIIVYVYFSFSRFSTYY